MKAKALFTLCLLAMGLSASADDFGLRTDVDITKSIGSGFSVDADFGYRMQNHWKSVDRWSAGIGLNYKLCKYLKFSTGYTYIYSYKTETWSKNYNKKGEWRGYNVDHAFWRSKNRFTLSATGNVDILPRLNLSLREMLQITRFVSASTTEDKRRFEDSETSKIPPIAASETDYKKARTKQYLRSRIGLEYDIRHCPLIPYVQFELSNNLDNGFSLDKRRWSAGVEYKISKQHRLSVGYVYDNGVDDESESDIHCIEIGYKYKF